MDNQSSSSKKIGTASAIPNRSFLQFVVIPAIVMALIKYISDFLFDGIHPGSMLSSFPPVQTLIVFAFSFAGLSLRWIIKLRKARNEAEIGDKLDDSIKTKSASNGILASKLAKPALAYGAVLFYFCLLVHIIEFPMWINLILLIGPLLVYSIIQFCCYE
jgi:hypothetical protein